MTKINERLKFYGLNDAGTFMQVERFKELLTAFDTTRTTYNVNEVLEFFNALIYIDNLSLLNGIESSEVTKFTSIKPHLYKLLDSYFSGITDKNITKKLSGVGFNYYNDLITVLITHRLHEQLDSSVLLPALKAAKIPLYAILENKTLVNTYDNDIRDLIVSKSRNAEIVIGKLLEKDSRRQTILPTSLKPDDITMLLEEYIDSEDANPNYLELIASSKINKSAGINAKLKLKAKQRHDAWTNEFFKDNQGGIAFGLMVSIVDEQEDPLIVTEEDRTTKFAYGRKWLDKNREPGAIISTFITLFQFVDKNSILSLPAYRHELGVFERITMKGKDSYPVGVAFQFKETASFYQTLMYDRYLRDHDTNLEEVYRWFFSEYLKNAHEVDGLIYTPSTQASTYLEKCRHVFAEMDSIIKQYSLFVENGELDPELLKISSESYAFADIPSLLDNKYAYATDNIDIQSALHLMFSDQSSITYINEDLKGKNLVELITNNEVKYGDFQHYQLSAIDKLIELNILSMTPNAVIFRSKKQVAMLHKLFKVGAINYNLVSPEARTEIDSMIAKEWLITKNSLLTKEESSLFNYYLNQKDFGNGLDLRNKYLHGSQGSGDDETEHYRTYIIAIELLMLLVLKINNDFFINDSFNEA